MHFHFSMTFFISSGVDPKKENDENNGETDRGDGSIPEADFWIFASAHYRCENIRGLVGVLNED